MALGVLASGLLVVESSQGLPAMATLQAPLQRPEPWFSYLGIGDDGAGFWGQRGVCAPGVCACMWTRGYVCGKCAPVCEHTPVWASVLTSVRVFAVWLCTCGHVWACVGTREPCHLGRCAWPSGPFLSQEPMPVGRQQVPSWAAQRVLWSLSRGCQVPRAGDPGPSQPAAWEPALPGGTCGCGRKGVAPVDLGLRVLVCKPCGSESAGGFLG